MTGRKSQQELEQPAKVYQLDAVEGKVDQALAKLDTITQSIQGIVTPIQMEAAIKSAKSEMEEKIRNDIEAIHLKYNPTYKGIWWVVTAVSGLLITSVWAAFNNFWRGS